MDVRAVAGTTSRDIVLLWGCALSKNHPYREPGVMGSVVLSNPLTGLGAANGRAISGSHLRREVCLVRRHEVRNVVKNNRAWISTIRHWSESTRQVLAVWSSVNVTVISVMTSVWRNAIADVLEDLLYDIALATRTVN